MSDSSRTQKKRKKGGLYGQREGERDFKSKKRRDFLQFYCSKIQFTFFNRIFFKSLSHQSQQQQRVTRQKCPTSGTEAAVEVEEDPEREEEEEEDSEEARTRETNKHRDETF